MTKPGAQTEARFDAMLKVAFDVPAFDGDETTTQSPNPDTNSPRGEFLRGGFFFYLERT